MKHEETVCWVTCFSALDRHWKEKKLEEMTERDWRVFREDFNLLYKGSRIPKPVRSWDESNLSEELLKAVNRTGYKKPSPIQMVSIPLGLQQRDAIGIAEAGSGLQQRDAIGIAEAGSDLISQNVIMMKESEKMPRLRRLAGGLGDKTAIVFVNTRNSVDMIFKFLYKAGFVPQLYALVSHGIKEKLALKGLRRRDTISCDLFAEM